MIKWGWSIKWDLHLHCECITSWNRHYAQKMCLWIWSGLISLINRRYSSLIHVWIGKTQFEWSLLFLWAQWLMKLIDLTDKTLHFHLRMIAIDCTYAAITSVKIHNSIKFRLHHRISSILLNEQSIRTFIDNFPMFAFYLFEIICCIKNNLTR